MIGEVFTSAYEPFVRARLAERGIEITEDIEAAIGAGAEWLTSELAALERTPAAEQRRGPLELFQAAMRFPTEAIAASGLSAVERDEVVANALPGDTYGLAPASSNELGEEAWHAHLAWGAAKAAALRPARRVAVLSRNLMDKSKLDAALRSAGFELVPANDDQVELLVADLEHPSAIETIQSVVGRGAEAVGFGPHVDKDLMSAAEAAGATAIPRSAVLRDADAFARQL